MNTLKTFFLTVLCFTGALFAKDSAAPQLGYNLQPGDSYLVNVTNNETFYLTIGNQSFEISSEATSPWSVQITKVDKKGITAQASLALPDYLKEMEKADQVSIKRLVEISQKNPIQLTFTTRGEITSLRGYEAMPKALSKAFSKQEVKEIVDLFFNKDSLTHLFGQFICTYPQKNTDSWAVQQKIPYEENFSYQLVSFDENSAHLSFQSTISFARSHFDVDSFEADLKGEGQAEGTNVVDSSTGWLLSSSKKGTISGQAKVSKASYPFTIEIEETIESTKL